MAKQTELELGRVYAKSDTTYSHMRQILHLPEIDDTTSETFLSTYGFSANEKVFDLSVQLPLRVNRINTSITFENFRIVIFNGFTGTINNDPSSAASEWFSVSGYASDIDNMLIKWTSDSLSQYGFCKTAIDAGNLIGTPLAYIDTSFTSTGESYEIIGTFNSSNSTVTITDEGKNINNWAPKGYQVKSGYGLFIGFYNTAENDWSVDGGKIYWGRYGSTSDPYARITLTTGSNIIRYRDGSAWKDCQLYYRDGSEWRACRVNYFSNNEWKTIG